jgi:ribosome-binding factor A
LKLEIAKPCIGQSASRRRCAKRSRKIVGFELEDPRLTMVTVTEVRVADDLRDASVYVTVQGDENEHQEAFKALEHARRMCEGN